jgi:ATP-binding cassette subfamily C (CFTR/MRP) protein 1
MVPPRVLQHVGATLVSDCILGTLADCCVVLATHRYSSTLLSAATNIIMLEDGRITGTGTHDQLVAKGLMDPLDDSEDAGDTPRSGTPTAKKANGAAAPDAAEQEKAKTASNMTGSEERSTGKISSEVYGTYLTAFGGYTAVALLLLGYVILQLGDVATNRWLAYWSTMEVSVEDAEGDGMSSMEYLGIYSLLSAAYILWNPVVLMYFMLGGMRAAVVQHRDLLRTVLRAPMEWFDV